MSHRRVEGMRVGTVARALGVHRQTVLRWVNAGKLRTVADLQHLVTARMLAHRMEQARTELANADAYFSRAKLRAAEYEARGKQPRPTTVEDTDTRGIVGDKRKYWGK